MARKSYKPKIEKIEAEQLLTDTLINYPTGTELVKAGRWVIYEKGVPITMVHDAIFSKKWEED